MSAQELLQVHDEVEAVDIIGAEMNDKDFYPPQHGVVRLIELTRQVFRLVTVTELMLINPPSTADIESLSASEFVDSTRKLNGLKCNSSRSCSKGPGDSSVKPLSARA